MNKILAVLVVSAMFACGCESNRHKHDEGEPKKMSVDKSAKSCPAAACDKAAK